MSFIIFLLLFTAVCGTLDAKLRAKTKKGAV